MANNSADHTERLLPDPRTGEYRVVDFNSGKGFEKSPYSPPQTISSFVNRTTLSWRLTEHAISGARIATSLITVTPLWVVMGLAMPLAAGARLLHRGRQHLSR